jgi:hypothetical protein
MMLLRFLLSVAIACPLLAQGQQIQFEPVGVDVIQTRLERNPATNGERAAALHKIFEEAGCSGAMLADQAVADARQPNVICTFAGGTASTIVIGAHIDFNQSGKGAVENWSGASLLPSLFEALRGTPRRHNFVFVGFADREKERRGSSFYVKNLGPEKAQIKAMIDVEALGLSETKVELYDCDKVLSQKIASIAKSLNIKIGGANSPMVEGSDARSFHQAKIPVISVHSLYGDGEKIPGGYGDRVTAIHMKEYYESYRLLAAYLAYLDQTLN